MANIAKVVPGASVADLVGLSAAQVINLLPHFLTNVSQYTFLRYTPTKGVDERVRQRVGPDLQSELARFEIAAPKLFERIRGLAALTVAMTASSTESLEEMLSHDESRETNLEFSIDASILMTIGIGPSVAALEPQEALGLSSVCTLNDGQPGHIPLLDFSLSLSDENQTLVENAARLLGLQHALVLNSGRSYHVYGLCIFSQNEWIKFLARALLLAPMVDVRYVAHRLIAGHAVLRINATPTKFSEPRVVASF
jgi:hypothetical protein